MKGTRANPPPARARRPSRRGIALVYATIVIVALLAFVSLGVDVGRVQLARGELQVAADAAARHAAHGFRSAGVVGALFNAYDAANDNTADGTPVTLRLNEDVEFGTWNTATRVFTKLPNDQTSNATAIRVFARRTKARSNAIPLAWGTLIGMPTCDVTVQAVARLAPASGGTGFVGLSSLQIGNNAVVAAYDASVGAPGGTNLAGGANVGSNSSIQIGNNSSVNGDAFVGPGGSYQQGNGGVLTGDERDLQSAMVYPGTEASPVASSGILTVGHGQTRTLAGGTYCYSEILVGQDATLTFSGDATVYVTGKVTLDNKATLSGANRDPGQLKVRLTSGASSFTAANNCTIICQIYAPGARFDAGNDVHVRGSVVAKDAEFGNNANIYYDTHSAPAGSSRTIVLLD